MDEERMTGPAGIPLTYEKVHEVKKFIRNRGAGQLWLLALDCFYYGCMCGRQEQLQELNSKRLCGSEQGWCL